MWREMRRKNDQISQEEAERVLRDGKRGVLAVLGDDGYPYTVPLDYVLVDGKIIFHSAVEGHKLDAIAAYDKVSFCVLSEPIETPGEWWLTFCSVVVFGRIKRIADDNRKRELLWKLGEKYFPSMEGEHEHIERTLNRVAILELEPEHLTGKRVREK